MPEIMSKNNISVTELLNNLLKLKFKIKTVTYNSKWFEIDNKKDLKFFLKNINN